MKKGRHDLKFGYEYSRSSISQIFNRGFRGKLQFDSLDDFIAGIPNTSIFHSTQASGDTNRNTLENSHGGCFPDSIRMARNFTLNLGVRYDYFGIVQEKHGPRAGIAVTGRRKTY